MQNLIQAFDLAGLAAAVAALGILLLLAWRRVDRDLTLILLAALFLRTFESVSNFLEWSNVTGALDPFEDFTQVLEPVAWVVFCYSFVRNITMARIRSSEEKYRLLVENQTDMVVKIDPRGKFLYVSDTYCSLFGRKREELVGQTFMPMVHEEDRQATAEAMKDLFRPPHRCYIQQRARTVLGWRWIAWADKAIVDGHGEVTAIVGLGRDITQRKNIEDERERLLHTLESKNKELESVVYIASHDLQSPLVNLRGFSGELRLACEKLGEALAGPSAPSDLRKRIAPLLIEDIPEALHFIEASAAKMQSLIDGLLRISRIGTAELNIVPLDMNRLLSGVVGSMNYQIQQGGAEVIVEPLPPCMGDPAQVGQVFSNLLDNALKYSYEERPTRIRISGRRERHSSVYRIQDNGMGIAPEHQRKIFEIFHRLNPSQSPSGEGLGLTIVSRILDRMNGSIEVQSELGTGSTFVVRLPGPTEAERSAATVPTEGEG